MIWDFSNRMQNGSDAVFLYGALHPGQQVDWSFVDVQYLFLFYPWHVEGVIGFANKRFARMKADGSPSIHLL